MITAPHKSAGLLFNGSLRVKPLCQSHSLCRSLASACFLFLCAGCGLSDIDASSADRMAVSIEHIRAQLREEELQRFDNALRELNDILCRPDALTQATIGFTRPETLVRKILHGKSAVEVIAMVEAYQKK